VGLVLVDAATPFDEPAPASDMTKTETAVITPRRITHVAFETCVEFFLNFAGFFIERDLFIFVPSNDQLGFL
jgi:hypothetical protein